MKWIEHAIIPVTLLMVITLVAYARLQEAEDVTPTMEVQSTIPDFGSYENVTQKKQDFFDYLLPMIRNANARVLANRQRLETIAETLENRGRLGGDDKKFVEQIARDHKVKLGETIDSSDLDALLMKVDVVPASLILAQAANESAWGTSRFARQAYNFFGIWCFTPGCGVTPRYRDEGLTHEVKKFASVQDGVHHYLRIINSVGAYHELRRIRANLRAQNRPMTGARLAEGLVRYSERGEAYVEEIQAMIDYNALSEYTLSTVERPPNRG